MPHQDEPIYKHKESGCSYCSDRGYRGRAGLYELLVPTPELNELVQKKSPDDDLHHLAIEQGMSTLASEGYNYVRNGLTSIKEINRVL
jgi:type IV pilus assembly protein PilB